jgi:hypothetical protein
MQTPAWKLKQFNLRARYLAESRFLQWIQAGGNKQPNLPELLSGKWLVYEGLHREDLDSFILNLRLLIQDRDGFSVRCLSEIYEAFPADYQQAKDAFVYVRSLLSKYLESPSMVRLNKRGKTTKLAVLETVLYGGFAHTDPKHHDDFLTLTTSGIFSMISFIEFTNIIVVVSDYVRRIETLNGEVLGWLEGSNNSFKPMPLRGTA